MNLKLEQIVSLLESHGSAASGVGLASGVVRGCSWRGPCFWSGVVPVSSAVASGGTLYLAKLYCSPNSGPGMEGI